ncbi:uncharacterized protein LOC122032308 [Zingiber officinale]|uniref:Uncharacterized protein n=1 Tax=Zingiber officinale TaxID=94328 RepID=A0A8J5EB34_ZINOF|nr:uncharacterized protein LOC122032308 [Zingiber officinale]KAG6469862.1 hypothetical protein ZIOFF_070795 [Zingiber officinale]
MERADDLTVVLGKGKLENSDLSVPSFMDNKVLDNENQFASAGTGSLLSSPLSKFEEETPTFLDKPVTEIVVPDVIDFSNGDSCPIMKDIGVDEGCLYSLEKVLLESDVGDKKKSSPETEVPNTVDHVKIENPANEKPKVPVEGFSVDADLDSEARMSTPNTNRENSDEGEGKARLTNPFESTAVTLKDDAGGENIESQEILQAQHGSVSKMAVLNATAAPQQNSLHNDNEFDFPGSNAFSGPIAYSGNISMRSDSSTTSARSFAFPIMQREWNTSPVKMAKARKTRSWRMVLICCKF